MQISEDEFQLTEPGGWKRLFRRSGKNSDVLEGGGGWKGQLSPDRATLWSDCGWRIDLHKGKIVQMKTPHGQTLSYNYTNGRIASVACGMKTLIAVDSDEGPDRTLEISIEEKCYSLIKTNQPRVQRVEGVNIIGGNDQSLSQFSGPDRQTRSYAYGVDDHTHPTITITAASKQQTMISWDPETRLVTRYGEWKYDIKHASSPLENAAISRTNAKGQSEFWFYNSVEGKEEIQDINGITQSRTWFTSGLLSGKLRGASETNKDITTKTRYSYSDDGAISRIEKVRSNKQISLRHYLEDGTIYEISTTDTNSTTSLFDNNGALIGITTKPL